MLNSRYLQGPEPPPHKSGTQLNALSVGAGGFCIPWLLFGCKIYCQDVRRLDELNLGFTCSECAGTGKVSFRNVVLRKMSFQILGVAGLKVSELQARQETTPAAAGSTTAPCEQRVASLDFSCT